MDSRKWTPKSLAAREQMELGDVRPWAQRPGITLAGLRRQGNDFNWLHDNIDLRWSRYCVSKKLPLDHELTENEVLTDYVKSFGHQNPNGTFVLHCNSKAYSHNLDRSLIPVEHFALQGWHIFDLQFGGITAPFDDDILEVVDSEALAARKKRRSQKREPDAAVRKIAGNGMCLSEIGRLYYASYLAQDNGMFQNGPSDFVFDFEEGVDPKLDLLCVDTENLQAYDGLDQEGDGPIVEDDEIGDTD